MSESVILTNGVVVTAFANPEVIPDGAVVWQGDRVVDVGARTDVAPAHPEARLLDARGGLVIPGLINLHHHFYSALARGLDPGARLRTFGEVLDQLWWRLDRALTQEAVRVSALLSVADCIRWGCTTVFDHHASPSCLRGSLETIAEAVRTGGVSAVLCYEVSDRNGHHEALAGLDENLSFIADHRDDPTIRGMLGLHASFTVRDETLDEAARRRPDGAGCHVHVAEDALDLQTSRLAYGAAPVERLLLAGLLDEHAILAHGVHLATEDYDAIARCGATLVHNPESNANNGVGRLDLARTAQRGVAVGLGTDGMSSAMLRALRSAFLAHRAGRHDPGAGFHSVPRLLATNATAARRFFSEPLLGRLAPGAPADMVVVDAPSPTRIGPDNVFGHLVYGASEAPIRHTVARGAVLLEDFRHTTVDPAALAAEARALARDVWERFRALSGGTSLSGA